MNDKIKLLMTALGEDRVKTDIDLSEYLQTGLGGKVAAFYIVTTTRELIRAVQLCQELKIKFLIVGSGSKIALSLRGWEGLVIKNRSDQLKIFGVKGKVSRTGIGIEEVILEAGSGTSLSRLSDFAHEQNLGGFEVLKTILGTIGGSIFINPTLRDKTHQVKVLTSLTIQKTKVLTEILKEDVILEVLFKLKAKQL